MGWVEKILTNKVKKPNINPPSWGEPKLKINRFESFKEVFKYNDTILNNHLCWHVWKVAWSLLKRDTNLLLEVLIDRQLTVNCNKCEHMKGYNPGCIGCRNYDERQLIEEVTGKTWKEIEKEYGNKR
jgi:hypothetical protein